MSWVGTAGYPEWQRGRSAQLALSTPQSVAENKRGRWPVPSYPLLSRALVGRLARFSLTPGFCRCQFFSELFKIFLTTYFPDLREHFLLLLFLRMMFDVFHQHS